MAVAFDTVDVIVLVVASFLSLIIGGLVFKFGGSQRLSVDYFLGGRKQHFIPVCLSLAVSYQSSIVVLGTPAEIYIYGPGYMIGCLGMLTLIPTTFIISLPLFYKLKLTSLYQYFDKRFATNHVRCFMVVVGISFNMAYVGIVLLGPAMVFQPLFGIPEWAIIVIICVFTVLYTSVGGIKAVIWTDVFQACVMLCGLISVLVIGTSLSGGPSEVVKIASEYNRSTVFDFNPDPTIRHTFWTVVIGNALRTSLFAVQQPMIQRLNSTPTIADARLAVIGFVLMFIVIDILSGCCGLVAFAVYVTKRCDPLQAKIISNPNQIMISTIQEISADYPGLYGMYMSSVLCASISTISSCLNSMAAITSEDLIKVFSPNISDPRATIYSKLSIILYGALSCIIAIGCQNVPGSLVQITISILGALMGPIVGVYLLSVFYKNATSLGTIVGGIAGFVIALWLLLGYNFSKTLPKTPWLPPGPVDGCPDSNHTFLNGFAFAGNLTGSTLRMTTDSIINVTETAPFSQTAEGLDKLYSLSYQYFPGITLTVTLIVGIITSIMKPSTYQPPSSHLLRINLPCARWLRCGKGNITDSTKITKKDGPLITSETEGIPSSKRMQNKHPYDEEGVHRDLIETET